MLTIPKKPFLVWATIFGLLVVPSAAEAQRLRQNIMRDQTYQTATGTVTAAPRLGRLCQTDMSVQFDAPRISFYANGQSELQVVWGQWLGYLREQCPDVKTVYVLGSIPRTRVYRGRAAAADRWVLQHEETPLKYALDELGRIRSNFEDTRPLENLLQKYTERFGGESASDTDALKAKIEERKAQLAEARIQKIEADAQRIPSSIDGLNQIANLGARELTVLQRSYPQYAARVDEIKKRREAEIEANVLRQFANRLKDMPKGWKEAAATIRSTRSMRDTWGTRIPDIVPLAEQAIGEVEKNVSDGLDAFKSSLESYPKNWVGLKISADELMKMNVDVALVRGLTPYISALTEWRGVVFASLEQQALSEIAGAGSTLDTLESVIQIGEALTKPFADIGASESADRLRKSLAARVVSIAENNFDGFERELVKAETSIASFRELQELERQYAELSQSIAVFGRYQGVAARRSKEIKTGLCSAAFEEFGRASLLDSSILTAQGQLPLKEVVCTVALNGGKLTADAGLWQRITSSVSGRINLFFEDYVGNASSLSLLPLPENKGAYAAVSVRYGKEEKPLNAGEWKELVRIMMQGPPSGKPDNQGRTECDLLAADPEDKQKLGEGRHWGAEADPLHLAERAMEACIAALETTPDEPRLQYQLGRLLWSMGEQIQSKGFIDAAAAKNYAAALALKAERILEDNNTYEGFVDAYVLLEQSAKSGYQPAIRQAKELNPDGLDIYKEIPAPTSKDMLTALPGQQCAEVLGMRMCVRISSVDIKNCMQINRSDFLCEYIPAISCDNNYNAGYNAIFGAICRSERELAFGTFRKVAEGRWQRLN